MTARLQAWKGTGSYFDYQDQKIFYKDEGQGDVILLIHGFPTSSWDWWKLWPTLTKDHRVVALDLIGFGFSDKPNNYKYSIIDQADVVQQFMRHLSITKCKILAHDYGDTVTQELLARHNEGALVFAIASICFLNGGLFPETHHPRLIQTLLMSPIGFLIGKLMSKKKLQDSFNAIFGPNTPPSEEEIDEFWEANTYNNGTSNLHKLIFYMAERKQYRARWVGGIQQAKIPIRLIDGGYDPISGAHMAVRYKEIIPNPDVIVLEDIGHYPQTEAPSQVLSHYKAFIASH